MKKNKTWISSILVISLIITTFVGCGMAGNKKGNTPINITVWTYYNGDAKNAFDKSVAEFNSTVGAEKNIVINAYSQGDVNELADAVLRAAKKDVGADKMPHIFAAYNDTALPVDKLGLIADLDDYFTQKELSKFRNEFVEDGRFGTDNELKILPVAKSTENLFLNKTDFDVFASATGVTTDDLETWEGIQKASEKYYTWSGGKALFGVDAMANFMLISCAQLGIDFYNRDKGTNEYEFSKETAKQIWDSFYIPYIKGYYGKIGRFRSDDAKAGDILAYVGSTAGSAYFPENVEKGIDNIYPIESDVLPYPTHEGRELITIQQGAGMAIAKSDKEHEEAAATFLKWFTESEQNLEFAVSTGYLPVKNDVMNIKDYERKIAENKLELNSTALKSAKVTFEMLKNGQFYTNAPTETSYEMRKVLENSLVDYAKNDTEKLDTEENFNNWYTTITDELDNILTR